MQQQPRISQKRDGILTEKFRIASGKRMQAWQRQSMIDAYRDGEKLDRPLLNSIALVLRCRNWQSELVYLEGLQDEKAINARSQTFWSRSAN